MLAEDAERVKALKDVADTTTKEKGQDAEVVEKKAQTPAKAREVAEKKLSGLEASLGSVELKLPEVESLNLANADKIANLTVAFEAYEDNCYNEGFVVAKNSWSLSFKKLVSRVQRGVADIPSGNGGGR